MTKLQSQVNQISNYQYLVELDDVRMMQFFHNLYLTIDFFQIVLIQLRLVYNFYGDLKKEMIWIRLKIFQINYLISIFNLHRGSFRFRG